MKTNKVLLNVSKIEDIKEYKKLGVSNFLFPLKDFSIGYETFSFSDMKEINGNVYVLINRILTDEDIDKFLNLDIPSNVKGFVLEDVGLYYVLKDKHYELILFQNHLNNNFETINFWLKNLDSVVISSDITREEIKDILNKTDKPLVLNTFGYPMIMYSRRRLVSNYYKHYGIDLKHEISVEEKVTQNNFNFKENDFGTAVFNNKISDYRELIDAIDDEKIKYYLYFSNDLTFEECVNAINGLDVQNTSSGFLDKKTIYRVGDLK